MGILSWIVFGLVCGAVAKLLMPGEDPGGIVVTALIGIAGAVVGGFIATRFGLGTVAGFDIRSFAIAIGGAMVLLLAYRMLRRR